MVGISLRGLVFTDSFDVMSHLYFVVFKSKKDNDYKLFTMKYLIVKKKQMSLVKKV